MPEPRQQKAKGSIIFELLIVILTAMLVASILYPKKITSDEEKNQEICRNRIEQIQKTALQYQKYKGVYTDTLSQLFDFVRNSEEYAHYVDSLIIGGLDSIITTLVELRERQDSIAAQIPSATDSVMIDSLAQLENDLKFDARQLAGYVEFVHDKMKALPNMPIKQLQEVFITVDSKQFTLDMDIVRNSIESGQLQAAMQASRKVKQVMQSALDRFTKVKNRVPAYKDAGLDSLAICPTTGETLQLVHVDTSAIKYLNVYCPIDSIDVAAVESDFLKSTIGGLSLSNHGKIESGEKSWEEE